MHRYIIRRLLMAVPVLIGITIITFIFTELAPGDAVSFMILSHMGESGDIELDVEALRAKYGLDQPAPVRYLRWMGGILQGNMGVRIRTQQPVSEVIGRRVPATVQLMATALLISLLVGIPLGFLSAIKQYSWFDYSSTALVFIGISVPNFFAAIAAIYIVAVRLDWLPTSGYSSMSVVELDFFSTLLDRLKYIIMPATVLGIEGAASYMRYTRSSMLEVLRLDYVTVARSKGLRERTIISRHVFRNAVLPVITVIGLHLPALFGGALIIETIFNWPGLGLLYMDGIITRDYPLIMGMVLISASVIVFSNLLTDLTYAFVDPRIRYE